MNSGMAAFKSPRLKRARPRFRRRSWNIGIYGQGFAIEDDRFLVVLLPGLEQAEMRRTVQDRRMSLMRMRRHAASASAFFPAFPGRELPCASDPGPWVPCVPAIGRGSSQAQADSAIARHASRALPATALSLQDSTCDDEICLPSQLTSSISLAR